MAEARPGDDVEIWTGPPSRTTRFWYGVVRGLILVISKLLGRITVVGAEKVPTEGAFVLAPVHRSNVDFALTCVITRLDRVTQAEAGGIRNTAWVPRIALRAPGG